MKHLIATLLMLTSMSASAMDFSKSSFKADGGKNQQFTVGHDIFFVRSEIYINQKASNLEAVQAMGMNMSVNAITTKKMNVRLKGGLSDNDLMDLDAKLSGKLGVEVTYKMKANKSFIIEVSRKLNPWTFELQPGFTMTTGVRYHFN